MSKIKKKSPNTICLNKKAGHDFYLERNFECGIVLQGWEVKSLRQGKGQLVDSYVTLKNGEAFLLGLHISPLISTSTHVHADPTRVRKLLLHRKEIDQLIGSVERKGYSVLATSMYWIKNKVKVKISIGKGKKLHDKRQVLKDKASQRDMQRASKQSFKDS